MIKELIGSFLGGLLAMLIIFAIGNLVTATSEESLYNTVQRIEDKLETIETVQIFDIVENEQGYNVKMEINEEYVEYWFEK